MRARALFLWMCCAGLMLVLHPGPLHAQDGECLWPGPPQFLMERASPPDSVMMTMGSGTVKVCYSRPSARGRTVFGELVPWGRVWRTGANEPTILHLPAAAEVAGVDLEGGSYLILTIPDEEEWTVLFNTADGGTPMEMFERMTEVARGRAPAERLEAHVETFTMIGTGNGTTAEILLEWEHLRVRIPIGTIP